MKVISGAQTGADTGGLLAAQACGLPTGGWVPKGCRTDEGLRPELVSRFGLQETLSSGYHNRTVLNQKYSSCTIWFGRTTSPGARLTIGSANGHKKPIFILRPTPWESFASWSTSEQFAAAQKIMEFFLEQRPLVLNIAGNRESTHLGIQQFVMIVLTASLAGYVTALQGETNNAKG